MLTITLLSGAVGQKGISNKPDVILQVVAEVDRKPVKRGSGK